MPKNPECQICTLEVGDNAYVCKRCSGQLDRNLREIPSLAEEVETTHLRQSRTAKSAGIGIVLHVDEEDRPLPYNDRAPGRRDELHEILTGYAAQVVDIRGVDAPQPDLVSLSRFMVGHTEWLRHREDAAECQNEIVTAVHALRRSVDLPPERVFAGPCGAVDYDCVFDHDHDSDEACDPQPVPDSPPCTGTVFGARSKATHATCDVCGCRHEMADRRDWLLKAVEDQLDYAARLSQALSNLGRPVADSTIRKWAERGRLVAHGHDERDRPLYRVGDVIDLIAADASRTRKASA
jgi:hypothetical protein